MALYLVRHGISLPPHMDGEQGLSEAGTEEVKRIVQRTQEHNIHVSCIQHSSKKRARQTAKLFAAVLHPEHGVKERSGLNPMDDVIQCATGLNSQDNLMLVGHLPFMERLTSYLVTGFQDKPVQPFPTACIVCLEQHAGSWEIAWNLSPQL